jgi:hypothetical protein
LRESGPRKIENKKIENKFALDSLCPTGLSKIGVMKLKTHDETPARGQEVIARFGQAALIQLPNGGWQLKGGSEEDRLSAREWISLFMHDAVLQCG